MKTTLVNRFLFILLITPIIAFSNVAKKKYEKNKIIHKTFNVSATAMVDIANKYGNVTFTTWHKNTVEIEVKITVKGNDLEIVNDKLAAIDVNFYHTTTLVKAKTRINNSRHSWSFWGNRKNVNYQIDYLVKMPITNNVTVHNEYGGVYLDTLEGTSDIHCDYGKIIIGELKNMHNKINLEYCSKSTISYAYQAAIKLAYSNLSIDNAVNVTLNADYSTLHFTDVKKVTYNVEYGSLRIDKGVEIEGNSDYTTLRFGTIKKSLKIASDYGSIRIDDLKNSFDIIDIDAEYTGIKLRVSPQINLIEIDLAYAGFKYDDTHADITKSIEKNFKKHYEGVYGKGMPTSSVKIQSEYGSVSIKEN